MAAAVWLMSYRSGSTGAIFAASMGVFGMSFIVCFALFFFAGFGDAPVFANALSAATGFASAASGLVSDWFQ